MCLGLLLQLMITTETIDVIEIKVNMMQREIVIEYSIDRGLIVIMKTKMRKPVKEIKKK
jgi:diketogulonate reductase-like aldo/keto reductase